jgi:hypothetical protein
MNRLVNVSVNPGGRFGAADTEPVPRGMGSGAVDELMTDDLPDGLMVLVSVTASKPGRLV